MNILLLSGSLRKISYSDALLHLVSDLLQQEKHHSQTYNIGALPFYSDQLPKEQIALVEEFNEIVRQTEAIIFITPEYNHSVPAVLKNAIDVASRPAFISPLRDKAVTFITQSNNSLGGSRAQEHLKLILDSTLSLIFPARELMIKDCHSKFSSEMVCQDDKLITSVSNHVNNFIKWAQTIKRVGEFD